MRPGYPNVLVTESHWEATVATVALGVTGRDPALWMQASEAVGGACGGIGFEGDEVPTVIASLVDLGQLNSVHFTAPEHVRDELNDSGFAALRRRASLLRLSDVASRLLHEYVTHPAFTVDETSIGLPEDVMRLQDRRTINRFLGNRR